jgi:hypothetical protein
MYLSCKLIKQEMDHEQRRVIQSHIKDMQIAYAADNGIRFDLAASMHNTISRNLQLSLPTHMCYYTNDLPVHRPNLHLPRPENLYHFTSLTIRFYEEEERQCMGVDLLDLQYLLSYLRRLYSDARGLNRIVVCLPPIDWEGAPGWVGFTYRRVLRDCGTALMGRHYVLAFLDDGGVQVVWERRKAKPKVASMPPVSPVPIFACFIVGMILMPALVGQRKLEIGP